MKVLPLLFFLVLAGLLPSYPSSQTGGFKYYDNYTSRDYKWNPQNWGIVQDKKGIIYVGNGGGLLQFDGADWKVIRVPNNLVRSLAIHDSGTVYIGGRGEIGFLAPDPTVPCALRYVSLKKHLEPKEKGFDSVYRTHATQKGIYFRTAKFLFRWDPKARQMKTWKPKHQFKYSSTHGEQFFIHDREAGLMRMVGELLKLVPEGKEFVGKKIYMMVPYDDNNLLIGTRDNGFFLYNGAKVTPFPTQIDGYLKEKQLSHGIRLQSNPREFAMTTLLGGLLIMDSQGRLKYVFDGSSGLWEDNVKYVFEDSLGNLWLALQKGLSKLEYASSVRFYNKDSNLTDIVLSVLRHNGVIYAGTSTNGLYVLDANGRFRSIPGITGSCHSLLSTGDALLTASTNGVYLIENQICRKIIDTRSYVLYRSRLYPNRLWAGTQSGLVSLSLIPGNTWLEEHRLPSVSQTVRSIVENPDGSMWLGITPSGVLKVDSPGTPARSRVTSYDTSDGLPGGQINVFEAAGHVMFATDKGIFRFHKEKNAFVPDQTLGDFFAGGTRKVFRINEDRHKNIWLHSKSMTYQATPHPDQNYRFRTVPLRTTDGAQVNAIYPDPDGKTIWLATISGLYYYDTSVVKITPYTTYIRQVEANGITVFADESPSSSSQINKTSGTKPNEPVLTIKYPDRNLRFQFAAPFFEAESETEYHYSLEGYDKDWSAWKVETQKDYTNLDPGLYTFKVRASNIHGDLSEEARFKFKILPPWYRTWWAFILYALFFFAVVYLSVKWRSRRLDQDKLRLESIVDERTEEVSQQNQVREEHS
ncbi:MAG: hypothetical protein GY940_42460 [bacterium]|nr:hypothetical protein [bacterium]